MSAFHLAQLNIAKLLAPLDSPVLADFVANLDRINAIAEQAPGFIWRLQGESGDATEFDYFGPDFIVNLSVWKDIESLQNYVYHSAHVEVLKRKKEWFSKMPDAHMVMWWVPAGHLPTLEEAAAKLERLQHFGATEAAFTFRNTFPAPQQISELT